MPRIVCQLILPVSTALRADSVGMSSVLRDFCCTTSLPCPWEAGEGWKFLISKRRLVPVGSKPPEDGKRWGLCSGRERLVVSQGVDVCEWVQSERRGEESCDCRCLCTSPGRQGAEGSGYEQQRCWCQEADSLRSDERAPPGDRVQPCGNYQLPAVLTLRLASSSWCPLAPVCTPRRVWGLEWWCRWDWGSHTALHFYSTRGVAADLLGHECGGRGRESWQFLWLSSKFGVLRGSVSHYAAHSAASCHGHLPCCVMHAEPAQPECPLFDKPWEAWKLKWPALRRQDFLHHSAHRAWCEPRYLNVYSGAGWEFPAKIFPIPSICSSRIHQFNNNHHHQNKQAKKQAKHTKNQA